MEPQSEIGSSMMKKEPEEPHRQWVPKDQIFDPEHMYRRLLATARDEGLTQTLKALPYAKKMHEKETRKVSASSKQEVPYIIHPLLMTCHAHAMGIRDDTVLAVCLLHDVCEDCGIAPEDLPFSSNVREAVALLTKKALPKGATKEERRARDEAYYSGIRTSATASIVKGLDRCNNVALMSLSFSRKKLAEYIIETQTYVYPILDHLRHSDQAYSDAVFLIQYQLRSTIETIKALLNQEEEK